ncbi:MAG TPA: hypothetical protein VMZ52_02220 [Bryobacteraceae bacterium]|nr:hypothetical protein [Bryobacteraceae bacterium]
MLRCRNNANHKIQSQSPQGETQRPLLAEETPLRKLRSKAAPFFWREGQLYRAADQLILFPVKVLAVTGDVAMWLFRIPSGKPFVAEEQQIAPSAGHRFLEYRHYDADQIQRNVSETYAEP